MTGLLLMISLLAAQPPVVEPSEYYLEAGRVHLGTGEVLDGGVIHVKDGKIVRVARSMPIPSGAKVIDCASCEYECPTGAVYQGVGKHEIDPTRCDDCGEHDRPRCQRNCPVGGIVTLGDGPAAELRRAV